MTNEAAVGLELTAEVIKALKPGEPIVIHIREPLWPFLCMLGMLLVFIALLVLLVRGFIWWHRRVRLGGVAAEHGRFCAWLASRTGLFGLFISLCAVMYNIHHVLYSYSNTYPSAAHTAMMLSVSTRLCLFWARALRFSSPAGCRHSCSSCCGGGGSCGGLIRNPSLESWLHSRWESQSRLPFSPHASVLRGGTRPACRCRRRPAACAGAGSGWARVGRA